MIRYRVVLLPEVRSACSHLPPGVKRRIHAGLRFLESEPLAGKSLERDLIGYRSYAIPPHRIIYRVDSSARTVRVFLVEHRRDVYEILVEKIGAGEIRERRAIYVHK